MLKQNHQVVSKVFSSENMRCFLVNVFITAERERGNICKPLNELVENSERNGISCLLRYLTEWKQETELSSAVMNIKWAIDFSSFVKFVLAIKILQMCSTLTGIPLLWKTF